MKTTHSLYRVNADVWENLPYWKALLVREGCASLAMDYYRLESRTADTLHEMDNFEKLYKASEDARDFNRRLTEELNNELSGEDNEQGDETEEHE